MKRIEYVIQCKHGLHGFTDWIDDEELCTHIYDNLEYTREHVEELRKEARHDKNTYKYRILERSISERVLK